jgi:hypothetical protein
MMFIPPFAGRALEPRANRSIRLQTRKQERSQSALVLFYFYFIFFCWSRKFLQLGNNFIFFLFSYFSPQKIPLDTKSGGAGPSTGCPCG